MIRTFIETQIFKSLIDQHNDKNLESNIKKDILENPTRGDIVTGTGGIRKFRVADHYRSKGKRGGFRVLYLDLPTVERTYLLFLYTKDELENISSNQKVQLRKIVEGIKHEHEKKKN